MRSVLDTLAKACFNNGMTTEPITEREARGWTPPPPASSTSPAPAPLRLWIHGLGVTDWSDQ